MRFLNVQHQAKISIYLAPVSSTYNAFNMSEMCHKLVLFLQQNVLFLHQKCTIIMSEIHHYGVKNISLMSQIHTYVPVTSQLCQSEVIFEPSWCYNCISSMSQWLIWQIFGDLGFAEALPKVCHFCCQKPHIRTVSGDATFPDIICTKGDLLNITMKSLPDEISQTKIFWWTVWTLNFQF